MQFNGIYGSRRDVIQANEVRQRIRNLLTNQPYGASSTINRMRLKIEAKINRAIMASWFLKYDRLAIECTSTINFMIEFYRREGWEVPTA